jgi:hypothetical protein
MTPAITTVRAQPDTKTYAVMFLSESKQHSSLSPNTNIYIAETQTRKLSHEAMQRHVMQN